MTGNGSIPAIVVSVVALHATLLLSSYPAAKAQEEESHSIGRRLRRRESEVNASVVLTELDLEYWKSYDWEDELNISRDADDAISSLLTPEEHRRLQCSQTNGFHPDANAEFGCTNCIDCHPEPWLRPELKDRFFHDTAKGENIFSIPITNPPSPRKWFVFFPSLTFIFIPSFYCRML